MTDTLITRGYLELFKAGQFLTGEQAYVLTREPGLPSSLSGTLLLLPQATKYPVSDLNRISGTANIYDGNPVAFAATGAMDVGDAGRVIKVVSEYFGTFDDFAYYDSALPGHPFGGWIVKTSTDRDTPTGDILSSWKRFTRHVVPPRGTRFVVPKIGLTGGVGNTQYLDAFQMEVVPINFGAPTTPAFTKPRRLNVRVRPTRLNYSINPNFNVSSTGVVGSTGVTPARSTGRGVRSNDSLKITVATTATVPAQAYEDQYLPVVTGESLAVSFKHSIDASLSGSYRIAIQYYTETLVPVDTDFSTDVMHDPSNWDLVSLISTVPERADRARISLVHADTAPAVTDNFWIDEVLIEKSTLIGEYFDGDFGDDYLWKANGTAGQTWSYFYEDRMQRHYILERTLRENVPLGISIGDPEYAEGTIYVNRYGNGPYGYGAYGG